MNSDYIENYIESIIHSFDNESDEYIKNFLIEEVRIREIIVKNDYPNNKIISDFRAKLERKIPEFFL